MVGLTIPVFFYTILGNQDSLMETEQIGTTSPARQILVDEWYENPNELAYIGQMTDDDCNKLISNIKNANIYRRTFKITKFIIIICFIAVYIAFYFKLKLLGIIIQVIVLLVGLFSVISFFKLRKVETDPDYKKLYLVS